MKRYIIRLLQSFTNSPLRIFLLFWVLLYVINARHKFQHLLVKTQQYSQIHTEHLTRDLSRKTTAQTLRNSDDILKSLKENPFDTESATIEWYENKLKDLKPLGTSQDPFLHEIEENCQPIIEENKTKPLCHCVPNHLYGYLPVPRDAPKLEQLLNIHNELENGGLWKPRDCISRHKVAVIIPLRDRDLHLRIFLYHTHPIFQRQMIEYRIFVVEQISTGVFNKAIMMNAGYLETRKLWREFDCVVFHDVDMLIEDDRNLYYCGDTPRHAGAYIDKFNYRLMYPELFGGAVIMRSWHFETINGFSNRFYGWGGEDDDLYSRVRYNGMVISRYPSNIARYRMIPHQSDLGNPANVNRKKRVYDRRFIVAAPTDGLNSVVYTLKSTNFTKLYTKFIVQPACPLKRRGFLGVLKSHVLKTFTATLDVCKTKCSVNIKCLAMTWSEITNKCTLHSKTERPKPMSGHLHFTKDCSDQNPFSEEDH